MFIKLIGIYCIEIEGLVILELNDMNLVYVL